MQTDLRPLESITLVEAALAILRSTPRLSQAALCHHVQSDWRITLKTGDVSDQDWWLAFAASLLHAISHGNNEPLCGRAIQPGCLVSPDFFSGTHGSALGWWPVGVARYFIATIKATIAIITASTIARIVSRRDRRGIRHSGADHFGVRSGLRLSMAAVSGSTPWTKATLSEENSITKRYGRR